MESPMDQRYRDTRDRLAAMLDGTSVSSVRARNAAAARKWLPSAADKIRRGRPIRIRRGR